MSVRVQIVDFIKTTRNLVPWSGHVRAAVGALLGLALVTFVSWEIAIAAESEYANQWFLASQGASALLLFAVPSNPFAQPQCIIVGNFIGAVIGVAFNIWIPDSRFSVPIAIALTILFMRATNFFHPPSASTAVAAILGQVTTFRWVGMPVLLNTVLLVVAAIIWNYATGKQYPVFPKAAPPAAPAKAAPAKAADTKGTFSVVPTEEQASAILGRYSEVVDAKSGNLENVVSKVEQQAHREKLLNLKCSGVMSKKVTSVEASATLESAWVLLRKNNLKMVPVVDKEQRIVGVVSVEDYLKRLPADFSPSLAKKVIQLIQKADATLKNVEHIMQKSVRTAADTLNAIELMNLFAVDGHHHLPVVNADQKLVGVITQADLLVAIRALTTVEPLH